LLTVTFVIVCLKVIDHPKIVITYSSLCHFKLPSALLKIYFEELFLSVQTTNWLKKKKKVI